MTKNTRIGKPLPPTSDLQALAEQEAKLLADFIRKLNLARRSLSLYPLDHPLVASSNATAMQPAPVPRSNNHGVPRPSLAQWSMTTSTTVSNVQRIVSCSAQVQRRTIATAVSAGLPLSISPLLQCSAVLTPM